MHVARAPLACQTGLQPVDAVLRIEPQHEHGDIAYLTVFAVLHETQDADSIPGWMMPTFLVVSRSRTSMTLLCRRL